MRLGEGRGVSKFTGYIVDEGDSSYKLLGNQGRGTIAEKLGEREIIPNSSDRSMGRGSGCYLVYLRQLRGNYCK